CYSLLDLDTWVMLFNNGADIHFDNEYPLKWSIIINHFEIFAFIYVQGTKPKNNDELINLAIKYDKLEFVKFIHKHGFDIHANNEYLLNLACIRGHSDIVEFFYRNGANIRIDNELPLRNA